jgi:phage-related minor tail protein
MKKFLFTITVPALILLLVSCKSADKKADAIAEDMCNCFKGMEAKISNNTKKIFTDAANAADPAKSIQDAVMAIGEENSQQISQEMETLGEMEDENSETGRCMKGLEKKYDNAYSFNEEKTLQKIIKELEGKPGCDFTASLLKLGLKMKGKSGSD